MKPISRSLAGVGCLLLSGLPLLAHGTVVAPMSRVYRVYQSNPENPNFPLAEAAVMIDGKQSYYTWNELSRNIPEAVHAGLPPGFDYSPWVPDGQLASGGRVDPNSPEYPRTYAGLDQVSPDWPTESVTACETIEVDFLATAVHEPSVWDVWMTTADWDPNTALNWAQMEFLGRPQPVLIGGHYLFDLDLPADRTGHHVLWVAWQRDDPAGEVFFSTSDIFIEDPGTSYCTAKSSLLCGTPSIEATGCASASATSGFEIHSAPASGGKSGVLLYTDAGRAGIPFQGGFLCVSPPLKRTTSVHSGGVPGTCDGTFRIDMNAFASGQLGGSPAMFLETVGTEVNTQFWGRDSVATGSFLSAGLEYVVGP